MAGLTFLSGNRFRDLTITSIDFEALRDEVFRGLKELFLDDTLLSWDQVRFHTPTVVQPSVLTQQTRSCTLLFLCPL